MMPAPDHMLFVTGVPNVQFYWYDFGPTRYLLNFIFQCNKAHLYGACTGNTHKRMQKETGATILIRGKGSVKPGSRSKAGGSTPDEEDDLHVSITIQSGRSMLC